MKGMVCLVALLVVSSAQVSGQVQPVPYPASSQYAPTPVPDRIILSWTEDPATTMTVNWRTDVSVLQGQVEFALDTPGPQFLKETQTIPAEPPQLLESDLGQAHYHTATMRGLKPGTTYTYRVGDGVNWSE